MDNTINKPLVTVCAWCQKQFPEVNASVDAHKGEYKFSHGICKRHFLQEMIPVVGQEKAEMAAATKSEDLDLQKHPELVKSYSQGNFLPQQQGLKERLQKLANIKK